MSKVFNSRWVSVLVAVVVISATVTAFAPSAALAARGRVPDLNGTQQGVCTYIVRDGDTLATIAGRYGTTVQALMRMNVLANPNRILSGVALVVPCDGKEPSGTCGTYIVRSGDTLAAIARRFGLTWRALAETNLLSNPNRLWAGMSLQIPCSANAPPSDPQGWRSYSSTLYGYRVSYPADWTREVDNSAPAGPGRYPQDVTLRPKAGGLPQVAIKVLSGAPPLTGFEGCEQNFVFANLNACQILQPAGQTPAEVIWVFQRGQAHYAVIVSYEDESTLAVANGVAGSLGFWK